MKTLNLMISTLILAFSGAALASAQDASPLAANPWCNFVQNESGVQFQQRVLFDDAGTFSVTLFSLAADKSRGAQAAQAQGTWTLQVDQLTVTLNGQTGTYTMAINPMSPTGAAQMTMSDPDGSQTFDPCL